MHFTIPEKKFSTSENLKLFVVFKPHRDWRFFSKNRHTLFSLLNNHLVDYPTPTTLTYAWGFGSVAGLFLALQIITGIFLSMHYAPNILLAFDGLEHIMRDVNTGWVLRYLHANGASFFFVVVYLHIGRGFYYISYFRNSLVWVSGIIIFALMMAIAFMGYVLPWGQMSFWGATVITNLFSALPIIGQKIAFWLWGGFSVDNPTLNRFFVLHFLLPFVLLGAAGLHLILLHRVGSTNPLLIYDKNTDKIPFYPYFYWKDLVGFFIFLFLYLYFVFFLPDSLGHPDNYIEGNPMVTPTHIVPEWYFLPFYAILRSIPDKLGGVVLMAASIGILLLLPFTKLWPKYKLITKRGQYNLSAPLLKYEMLYSTAFWIFFTNVMLLAWIGSQPVTPAIVFIGQLNTFIYFAWLLYIPTLATLQLEEAAVFIMIMSFVKKVIAIIIASNLAQNPEILISNATILWPLLPPTYGFFDMGARLETTHYIFFICCFLISLYFVAQNKKQLEIYFFMACSVIPLIVLIVNPPNLMFFYLLLEFSTLSTTILLVSRRYNPFAVSAGLMYYFVSIFVSVLLLIGIFFYFLEYETLELVTHNKINNFITFEFNNLFKFWNLETYLSCIEIKKKQKGPYDFNYQETLLQIWFFPTLELKDTAQYVTTWLLENKKNLENISPSLKNVNLAWFFILLAFLVKMGIAPFHSWALSVNSNAPVTITAFLQTIYKGLVTIIFFNLFNQAIHNISPQFCDAVTLVLSILGFLTIIICTFSAIVQANIKHLWTHLSTAVMGFLILLGATKFLVFSVTYSIFYFFTSISFFSLILFLQKETKNKQTFTYLTDFKKTIKHNNALPLLLILTFLIIMFAGLPPLLGFFFKLKSYLLIFQVFGLVPLFLLNILHLVAAFLYLKIIKISTFNATNITENLNDTPTHPIFLYVQIGILLFWTLNWNIITNLALLCIL